MTQMINFVRLPQDGEKQNKGAKPDPFTWTAVPMRDDPSKYKVVDDSNPPINVAHMFNSQETAQQYIDHHLWIKNNPCPDGKVHDPMTGECIENSGVIAENGVLQIYENNPRIPLWVMGFGDWKQRRLRGGHAQGEDIGEGVNTVCEEKSQVRFNVKCKPDAGEGQEEDNQKKLARGWSDSPDDFVNIEQTGYIDVTELANDEGDQDVTWYGPTGRHTARMNEDSTEPGKGCWGSTYKGSLHAKNGKNRMAKEQFHVNYLYNAWKGEELESVINIIKQMNGQNKRVGFKWVNYTVGNHRRLEIWIDIGGAIGYNEQPKNEWQLIRVQEDTGGNFPNENNNPVNMRACNCEDNEQVILWGAPYCTYRWDKQTAKLSLATVQEINPPTTFYNIGDKVSINT